ncbi:uncharacterized protein [Elaeis guineensis]|uniref:Uncharacterized protein LOC105050306 isoform X1 n=1 Tax=Elaeis guineensis var. tenera TaxID=51953 RepID=A0A6I9RUT1_ELAGV|nr:uncharacterized protein LOC105050306 isoform X1 [Elaeis guineensis]
MHGREGEERKRRRHMWPVPAHGTAAAALPPPAPLAPRLTPSASDSFQSSADSFIKDGRKIRVGDCALFQAVNAPPFIGIIRWFSAGKEAYLELCVNWLYRPADVKLAKGISPEAAPNEVFYSFHKDVISAATLLHPCKVAFLRKGVDLPAGISSFVCRRVYDTANKCLWWLTDQDYINERQEEVDQLLDRTRLEMHAAVQSGGRSPKPLNGPASTQQLKSGSDSVQNSGTSIPQSKGKKRDRGDQGTEPIKRERSAKTEDGDFANFKFDGMIKDEIAKITEKGGLVNTEGVEKLVNLMQLDRNERKIDLAGRIMLADVIAATDKYECLGRFVQLRGVPVLDDWLQEAHKGKTGDGNSPKESDKATEELLLALLRALEKLPVNLHALRTCNIGKSVNHLRSHKNLEIHKKARSLVDTWKKRVDAEMTKNNDAKSVGSSQAVAWPGKTGFPEVSHAGSRRPGLNEVTVKSPGQPSACKTPPGKLGNSDPVAKPSPFTSGSLKQSPLPALGAIGLKDPLGKTSGGTGTQELPPAVVKEEKSSSSSQSQNNSQSCSSDHKKMGSSWKEDARSSTAGSMNASKISGTSSRHRRSGNGLLGTSNSGIQKEPNLGKSGSLNRTTTLDKASQSGLTCEKSLDVPVADHGNSHRLIVRLPNPGRSPARSASGGSFEDPSVTGSRASSPGVPDKHEHNDRKMKLRSDACRSHVATNANIETWESNDVKEGVVGSDEGDRSPTILDEERRSADETGKISDIPRTACSSSGNEKGVFLPESRTRNSFSSINALIESCAKYSESSVPLSAGDDIGMNLLASVAAGEMSKSDFISPTGSPGTSPVVEDHCTGNNEAKSRLSCDDGVAQSHAQSDETADIDSEKHGKSVGSVLARVESQQAGINFSGDEKIIMPLQDKILTGEQAKQSPVSSTSFHKTSDSSIKPEGKLEEERADRCYSMSSPSNVKEETEGDGAYLHRDRLMTSGQVTDSLTDCKTKLMSQPMDESKPIDYAREKIVEGSMCTSGVVCNTLAGACEFEKTASGRKSEKLVEESPSCPPIDKELPGGATLTDQQQPSVAANHAEALDRSADDAVALSGADEVLCPENDDESKTKKSDNLRAGDLDLSNTEKKESLSVATSSINERVASTIVPPISGNGVDDNLEIKQPLEVCLTGSSDNQLPCSIPPQETERCAKSSGSKISGADADGKEELVSSAEASSLAVTADPDVSAKLDFDLNEGIPGDDGNQGEQATSAAPICSSAVRMPNLPPFASPKLSALPAPITVAAPAKGPFVPPENLLKTKAEPGWKGSAATSAFRPAEPRKVFEMPLSTSDVPTSDAAGKQVRPPLDIDLNIADERVLEDLGSQSSAQTTGSESGAISNHEAPTRTAGGLDLDLNRADEGTENGQFVASTSQRLEVPLLPVRPAPGGFSNGEANVSRDFDLNNGPGLDEVGSEPAPRSQHAKSSSSVPFLPPVAGLRMNNAELGNVSSWFPSGNSYPAVAIPSFLPERGEQPYPIVAAPGAQRILGSVTGGGTFGNDIYRTPVLSSSPAMAFSPATAFPYAGFPFGSSFPLASTSFTGGSTTYVDSSSGGASCFPAISSQLVGPAGAVSSHYQRSYVINLPEGSSSGGSDNSRKWARQGLDLNAGPGSADMEGKDDRLPSASRQLLVAGTQAFVEEQARMYQVPGGGLKRKEPEGGWDAERSGYKQLSWQ